MGATQGASVPGLQGSLASPTRGAALGLEWLSPARLIGIGLFSRQGPGWSMSQAAAETGSPGCPLTSAPAGCVLRAGTQGDDVVADTVDTTGSPC